MSAYIKLATGEYPRHEGDIRLENPTIVESQTGETFPCPVTYALVHEVERPSFDRLTQRCIEGNPEQIDGVWKKTWIVRDATQSEIDQSQNFTYPQ